MLFWPGPAPDAYTATAASSSARSAIAEAVPLPPTPGPTIPMAASPDRTSTAGALGASFRDCAFTARRTRLTTQAASAPLTSMHAEASAAPAHSGTNHNPFPLLDTARYATAHTDSCKPV